MKYSKIELRLKQTLNDYGFNVDYLYENYFNNLKEIKERDDYHPEPSVYHHILKVYNRVYNLPSAFTSMLIAAIFHDIGKLETYTNYNNSYGHEKISLKIFKECAINSFLFDYEIDNISYIIENHMRIHNYEQMKKTKQNILNKHPLFEYLKLFGELDDMNNPKYNDKNL